MTKVYMLPFYPILVVASDQGLKTFYRTTKHSDKGMAGRLFRNFNSGNESIFTLEGAAWKLRRKHLNPTMHSDLMGGYAQVLQHHISQAVEDIGQQIVDSRQNDPRKPFVSVEVNKFQFNLGVGLTAENIFGQRLSDPADKSEFIDSFNAMMGPWMTRLNNPILAEELPWTIYCKLTGLDWKGIFHRLTGNVTRMIKTRSQIIGWGDEESRTKKL